MRIIIPYRDRPQHLPAWDNIPNVLIVEQAPGKPFNRGKLLNIGALLTADEYFVFNDIDLVPQKPFTPYKGVTQLAASTIQLHDYLGGSTMFDRETFHRVGGYNNDFWGRAEDNELRFNLYRLRIPVKVKLHTFTEQPHPRPAVEFDPVLWKKAQMARRSQNQLAICEYKVLSQKDNWITVEI